MAQPDKLEDRTAKAIINRFIFHLMGEIVIERQRPAISSYVANSLIPKPGLGTPLPLGARAMRSGIVRNA
ncbi:hypothetical protein [Caballeronia sp. AZ10_KS36]|uniref:hypothetical protein n=1 Tax=Caballeronia sp. AZ10_KS36 TaxID=2921757 RepID=UPI00202778B4|nr:hypothetical protein [Caballeronia sp. AZ10_KS36]